MSVLFKAKCADSPWDSVTLSLLKLTGKNVAPGYEGLVRIDMENPATEQGDFSVVLSVSDKERMWCALAEEMGHKRCEELLFGGFVR